MNQQDIQALITTLQAGHDALVGSMKVRADQVTADQQDSVDSQKAVDAAALKRQQELDSLVFTNQAANDAANKAEQEDVDRNNADITEQTATLALDQQALDATEAVITALEGLAPSLPAGPAKSQSTTAKADAAQVDTTTSDATKPTA